MVQRIIYQGIKNNTAFSNEPLLIYDYKVKEIIQKTTYIIKHNLDWVSEYFIEEESQQRNFQILSEVDFGQKNLFRADSAEPDQILLPKNEKNKPFIQIEYKSNQNQLKEEIGIDHQKMVQNKIKIYNILKCQNKDWEIKEYKYFQLIKDESYVNKNFASQSISLFYKSSLTKNIKYFNVFKEFLNCLGSFTIYKYYFKYGRIPNYHEINNLYLPFQSLQLIRDYVLKGYPYIYNLDQQNPQTYFEVKNDLLSVNNVYRFEGDYSIRIKYIGNLRDYCKKDTLYIGIAIEQVIMNHIIYESQLDYIQEILLNKMEQKVLIFYYEILDLLLLPIVIIELHRSKYFDNNQSYLLFGYKDRVYYLGNRQQNEIYIDSDSISNYQCSFEFLNGVWQIFDGYKNKYNERKPSVFGTWKLLYDEVEIKNCGQFKIKENIFRLQIT